MREMNLPPLHGDSDNIGSCRALFTSIECRRDDRNVAQRLSDVLSESHREDTSADFRLGLLQGALAVAMPELLNALRPFETTLHFPLELSAQQSASVAAIVAGKNGQERPARGAAPARGQSRTRARPAKKSGGRRHA